MAQNTAALAEADALLPAVKILNVGPRSNSDSASASSVAHYATGPAAPSELEVTGAARKNYNFLNKNDSKLRALLLFLSAGGLWYNAAVFEKSLRAWVAAKAVNEDVFVQVAVARTSVPDASDARDSMASLLPPP